MKLSNYTESLVRCVLVPATMTLLGRHNWYLPKWLEWLPDLRMEAGVSRPEPVATGSDEAGGPG